MTLGEKLKKLRKEKGFTQKQVSAELGITDRNYIYYEANQRKPPHDSLVKLANMFDTTTDYLLSADEYLIAGIEVDSGKGDRKKAQAIVSEVSSLFAGGELNEADIELVYKAITDIYFKSKRRKK